MMTILSAQYANAEHTAAVIQTQEAGAVLVSLHDTPELWAQMLEGVVADFVEPVFVPQSVTPFQARKALKQSGLLATVQGAVAAADEDTQMAWEYATSFDRTSEFVLGMAAGLGWTDEQVDNLFILAASL